jgi:hypothetical protein
VRVGVTHDLQDQDEGGGSPERGQVGGRSAGHGSTDKSLAPRPLIESDASERARPQITGLFALR